MTLTRPSSFVVLLTISIFVAFASNAQETRQAYFEISANSFKFERMTGSYGGSAIFNVKMNSLLGLGVGVSATKFERASSGYRPVFGNVSFFVSDGKKVQIIAGLKAGYAIYKSETITYDPSSNSRLKSTGGFYVSPGIGLYLKISKGIVPFFNVAYINGSFKNTLTTTVNRSGSTPEKVSTSTNSYNLNGVVFGLGIKLF